MFYKDFVYMQNIEHVVTKIKLFNIINLFDIFLFAKYALFINTNEIEHK